MRAPNTIWGEWLRRSGISPSREDLQLVWPGFYDAVIRAGYDGSIALWSVARPVKVLELSGAHQMWIIVPHADEKFFVVAHVEESTDDEDDDYDEDDEDDDPPPRSGSRRRVGYFRNGGGGEYRRDLKDGVAFMGMTTQEQEAIKPWVDGLYEVWGVAPRPLQEAPGEGQTRGTEVRAATPAEIVSGIIDHASGVSEAIYDEAAVLQAATAVAEASPEEIARAVEALRRMGFDPTNARETAEAARQAARERLLGVRPDRGPLTGVPALVSRARERERYDGIRFTYRVSPVYAPTYAWALSDEPADEE